MYMICVHHIIGYFILILFPPYTDNLVQQYFYKYTYYFLELYSVVRKMRLKRVDVNFVVHPRFFKKIKTFYWFLMKSVGLSLLSC